MYYIKGIFELNKNTDRIRTHQAKCFVSELETYLEGLDVKCSTCLCWCK